MYTHPLAGVYAAAVTPLNPDLSPDLEAIPQLLNFLAERGCHGALLLGTTGEGPSFSSAEREAIWTAALDVRQTHPDFRLMAGTGTPSLDETMELNRIAFKLGFDAVVTLPPFYFRDASEEGLLDWFSRVIEDSVPDDGLLLGYHFPKMSGVPLSISLLQKLSERFPKRFGGLKDSSGDLAHAESLAATLSDRLVLVGNDKILTPALHAGASGCITALANITSPLLREVWDAFGADLMIVPAQAQIDATRAILDELKPFPASLKGLMAELFDFPRWPLKPPLADYPAEAIAQAAAEMKAQIN